MASEFSDFFVASAGGAAALTGLIFVGISINLKEIIRHKSLPTKASLALVLLMTILISAISALIHLSEPALGYVMLITGLSLWVTLLSKDVSIFKKTPPQYRVLSFLSLSADQLAAIPYIIAGFCLLSHCEAWIYLMAAAYVLSFIKAVWDAWVLIIEIMR